MIVFFIITNEVNSGIRHTVDAYVAIPIDLEVVENFDRSMGVDGCRLGEVGCLRGVQPCKK